MDDINEINLKVGDPLPYEIVLKGGQIRFPAGQKVTQEILRLLRQGKITQIEIDWQVRVDDTPGLFDQKKPDSLESLHIKNILLTKKCHEVISSLFEPLSKPVNILKNHLNQLWKDPTSSIDSTIISAQIDSLLNTIPQFESIPAFIGWNTQPHDFFTSHLIDTLMLSSWLAFKLSFSESDIISIATASLIHDIGELFINQHALLKNDSLELHEKNRLKEHPRKSVEWMKRAGFDDELSHRIVLRHHERFDGSGYPFNLRGKILSPLDNIFAFCDVYTALISIRPHRNAFSRRAAIRTILENKDKWFPQDIIDNISAMIGIYPPGSLVQMKSGGYALIITPPSTHFWQAIEIDFESPEKKCKDIDLLSLKDDYIAREIPLQIIA